MQPKKKKCKGTGKAKGYGCGDETYHRVYGLCKKKCYPDWLLSSEQGKIMLQKATLKATKPRKDLEKAERLYKESKRLPEALKQTQIVFNEYIRLRDRFKPCISSNVPWKPDFDAGHLFTVKQYTELRFDEDNVHGQSIGDNRFKEGNFDEYITNLTTRIGQDRFQALLKRAERAKQTTKKWSLEELSLIRSHYKKEIKKLKQKHNL